MSNTHLLSSDIVWDRLATVLDPELHIDIVSMGLVYDVQVKHVQVEGGQRPLIHILLTLTTPGCPLAGTFDGMIKDAMAALPGIDAYRDVVTELTFDPPWIPDMMNEEARAELGF
jgi:metal-sulfur cluster biosynthetic enzyme